MDDLIKKAKKRVKEKRKYRREVITFAFVSILLLYLNFGRGHFGFPWSLIAIGAWAISIISTGIDLYGPFGNEEEELKQEIKRLAQKSKIDVIENPDMKKEKNQKKEIQGDAIPFLPPSPLLTKRPIKNWDEKDLV